ncbi:hypothetical protein ACE1TI_06720 [Alteribacillus sp. JSM 102045]|uniref:hypothetical protein n=1 Tax=Alteribacillus sp. JSM 102045 TaxID=1562101 RepID=UPI0035C186C6
MSNSKGNKAGYVKGLGRTFAPSLKADWVDEFNQILEDEPEWSRNRLTEHLIKKGLESQRMQQSPHENYMNLSIPSDGLTEDQQLFLESEEGRVFVGNAVRLLLMQPGSRESAASNVHLPDAPKPNAEPEQENSTTIEKPETNTALDEKEDETKKINEDNQRKEKKVKKEEKLSPLKRAKNKLKRQNLN